MKNIWDPNYIQDKLVASDKDQKESTGQKIDYLKNCPNWFF
jgi:hypothetical protein